MEPIHWLEGFLFQVSSGLYAPVVAAVAALTIYSTWLVGAFIADALVRWRKGSSDLTGFREDLARELLRRGDHLDARIERLLRTQELSAAARLDRVRFVIKVGPALGLMGTLIPMGVSLASLAEGNIPKMAGSMVTAFTATVAGLACGVVAYAVALVREKWLRNDLLQMEFLAETQMRDAGVTGPTEVSLALSETAPAA